MSKNCSIHSRLGLQLIRNIAVTHADPHQIFCPAASKSGQHTVLLERSWTAVPYWMKTCLNQHACSKAHTQQQMWGNLPSQCLHISTGLPIALQDLVESCAGLLCCGHLNHASGRPSPAFVTPLENRASVLESDSAVCLSRSAEHRVALGMVSSSDMHQE